MILGFIYKIICKTIYYAVLCITAIPVILYTILSEIRCAITKHSNRVGFPSSGKLDYDLSEIHFRVHCLCSSLMWGNGKMPKFFRWIRKLRGEVLSDDSNYWSQAREDAIELAKVLKDEYGIGDGIYRPNKEKDVDKDAKTVSEEDKDLH